MIAIAVTLCIVTIVCIGWASLFERTWPPPEEVVPAMRVVTYDGTGSRPAPYDTWDRMWNARVPGTPDVFSGPRQIVRARSLPGHDDPPVVHPPS